MNSRKNLCQTLIDTLKKLCSSGKCREYTESNDVGKAWEQGYINDFR